MSKRRFKPFHRNLRPVNLGGWKPEESHQHEFEATSIRAGNGKQIIIDKCKTCSYERARDLI